MPTRLSSHSSWKDKGGGLLGRLSPFPFGLGLKSLEGVCNDTHGPLVFRDPLTKGEIPWLRARSSWESPYVGLEHKRLTGHGRTVD